MIERSYTDLMRDMHQVDGAWRVSITDNWMQGRTTYGGLSSALCLQAVKSEFTDLPPIRSAQINFIGPAGGEIEIRCKELRRGKSVAFIEAQMHGEAGLATQAVFCFGAERESQLNADFLATPECPGPEQSKDFFGENMRPVFTKNFDLRLASGGFPVTGSTKHDHYMWIRFIDDVPASDVSILGIADMPPPAVMPMFKEFAPISSMTWMVNFLRPDADTEDGWWLMRSRAENVENGYSSQDMELWSANGELVAISRQSVAIFY